jgi:intracellular sulfur oxidation DsrE/DsrF family protein
MKQLTSRLFAVMFVVGLSMMSFNASAAKDFAEQKIVLQISDPNPFKQTLVLNVAGNLIRHYGTDGVEIEIVAFGPGLRLLFAENVNKSRINSLAAEGVTFSACENTVRNMGKILGHPPVLNDKAVSVSAGVVQIIKLQNEGYMLIKP